MRFLKNEITKESFNKTLMMRIKAKKKKQIVYQNLEMIENVSVDIFLRLFQNIRNLPVDSTLDLTSFFEEFDKIREYYNTSIVKTKERFGIKKLDVGFMNNKWEMIHS